MNGLGGVEYLWAGFGAALPPTLSLRVLDLPGHGDRPRAADYRYAALVVDEASRTADLGPFWSVGAAVAWLFAARLRPRDPPGSARSRRSPPERVPARAHP